jgi:hypothetical protein
VDRDLIRDLAAGLRESERAYADLEEHTASCGEWKGRAERAERAAGALARDFTRAERELDEARQMLQDKDPGRCDRPWDECDDVLAELAAEKDLADHYARQVDRVIASLAEARALLARWIAPTFTGQPPAGLYEDTQAFFAGREP